MSYQVGVEELKRQAREQCEGCYTSWRLVGWRHREPMPIECQAKEIRKKIRDLATASRGAPTR